MAASRTVKPRAAQAARPARKAPLGQNFLVDPGAAHKLVEALGAIGQAHVVEIGPGRGALTEMLVQRAGRLTVIELDRMLAAHLRLRYVNHRNVEVVEANVLNVDLNTLVQGELRGNLDRHTTPDLRKARLIGNLPYYITADILLRLFAFHQNFDVAVLMVQKEVADRLAAQPGTRDYGLLTVTTQLHARVEKLFTLPPGAFSPAPKVHSTVVRLTFEESATRLSVSDLGGFDAFLKKAFAQKRKMLANNLKAEFGGEAAAALKAAKVRPDARAEALSIEQLAAIHRLLANA